jgi:hypothetical protein
MKHKCVSPQILLLLVVLLFAVQPLAGQTSEPIGWEAWWANDPMCPCSPDAWDIYIVYGYPNGSGGYVVTGSVYAGQTAYYCGTEFRSGGFSYSGAWQQCYANNGCPCAGDVLGVGCPVLGTWGNGGCSGPFE